MSNRSSFGPAVASNSILAVLEKALARLDVPLGTIARTGAFAGAVTMAAAPSLVGCAAPATDGDDEDLGEAADEVIGGGQADWAQQQGQRNTAMVSYYKENWYQYVNCNGRFGCSNIDLYVKLRVKPAWNANLADKKVGVVFRAPGTNALTTVTGNYFTTWGNGDEEWHVKIPLSATQTITSFNAWYQDGAGNTFFDDNGGELHAVAIGSSYAAITQMYGAGMTDVAIDERGVYGKIAARLADIDWDKQVAMVWTTNNWASTNWMNMGSNRNEWHWAADYGDDYERWEVEVAIPGDVQQFQYAIVYRHGVTNGAQQYEFWDNNNGNNYVVNRP